MNARLGYKLLFPVTPGNAAALLGVFFFWTLHAAYHRDMPSPSPDFRIVSIGTLSAHPLWNEKQPVRTGHSTTTLVRSGGRTILVDPGLPGPAVAAKLSERAGISPGDITDVFLTSFLPDARRGIEVFENARWLIGATEREAAGVPLAMGLKRLLELGDDDEDDGGTREAVERDVAILQKCEPAPDSIAEGVDLFPLPGVTPGLCGLLLAGEETTIIAGDAVPTVEHMASKKVLQDSADVERAKESMAEAIEIADLLVLGRDNWVRSPGVRV